MRTNRGAKQLDALGDPSRRAIIEILGTDGPLSVSRLTEQMSISRPAVSQHLRVLRDAGLVRDTPDGTRRIYALDTAGLDDLRGYFSRYWRSDLQAFGEFVRAATDRKDQ